MPLIIGVMNLMINNNAGKFLCGLIIYFVMVTTNLMAEEMNKKLALDQTCFELLSLTLAEFGEDVLAAQDDGIEYRYEINCKENQLEIIRFQKSPDNDNFVLPRGGGSHYRTFAIENDKAIETTPASR